MDFFSSTPNYGTDCRWYYLGGAFAKNDSQSSSIFPMFNYFQPTTITSMIILNVHPRKQTWQWKNMVNNYHLKDVSPIKNGDSEFPLPCLFTGGQLLKITMLRSFPQPPSQCASSASRPAAACKALRKRTSSGSSGRVSRSCFKGKDGRLEDYAEM